MRNVTIGVIQMQCSADVKENIGKADEMVRRAAGQGAQVILLPDMSGRLLRTTLGAAHMAATVPPSLKCCNIMSISFLNEARLLEPGIPPGKIMTSLLMQGPKVVEALNSPNAISAITGILLLLVTILSS